MSTIFEALATPPTTPQPSPMAMGLGETPRTPNQGGEREALAPRTNCKSKRAEQERRRHALRQGGKIEPNVVGRQTPPSGPMRALAEGERRPQPETAPRERSRSEVAGWEESPILQGQADPGLLQSEFENLAAPGEPIHKAAASSAPKRLGWEDEQGAGPSEAARGGVMGHNRSAPHSRSSSSMSSSEGHSSPGGAAPSRSDRRYPAESSQMFYGHSSSSEGESSTVCSSPGDVLSPKFMKGSRAAGVTRQHARKPMSPRARARQKSVELKARQARNGLPGLLLPDPESPLQNELGTSCPEVMQLQSRLDEALKDLELVKRRQDADYDSLLARLEPRSDSSDLDDAHEEDLWLRDYQNSADTVDPVVMHDVAARRGRVCQAQAQQSGLASQLAVVGVLLLVLAAFMASSAYQAVVVK